MRDEPQERSPTMTSSLTVRLDSRSPLRSVAPVSASLLAMVDLRGGPGGDLILSWTEKPGVREKIIGRAEVARLERLDRAARLAESRSQGPAIVEAWTALSTALFELLDGPERALGQRIA